MRWLKITDQGLRLISDLLIEEKIPDHFVFSFLGTGMAITTQDDDLVETSPPWREYIRRTT